MDLKISDTSVITNLKIDTSTACGYGHNTIATTPYEAWRCFDAIDHFKPCTFTGDSFSINSNAFARLLASKEEKETKMKKDELKPVYNTDPGSINHDKYAGYSVLGIKILAENKVVVVTIGEKALPTIAAPSGFKNVHTYKQICREGDIFDLRYAVALALTKHLHRDPGKRLTTYGLERMTEYYLTCSYDFNKEVDRALKAYARCEREDAMKKAKEEEIKRIKERRAAKQKRNRERRRMKKQNNIN